MDDVTQRIVGIVLTAIGVVGGTVGAAVSEYPSLAFGGSFAALALFGFLIMYRSLKRDHKDCERKHDHLQWQFEILLGTLRHAGVPVPDEIWGQSFPSANAPQELPPHRSLFDRLFGE